MSGGELILYGVGRSGTTTLYNVVQKLLEKHYGCEGHYVYEPLLWRPEVFNKNVRLYSNEFTLMSSLSVDGMYANKRLPFFINDNAEEILKDFDANILSYLRGICVKPEESQFLFTKTIRACSRVKVFQHLNPEAKSLFIVRNPMDVINSVIKRFSFYGDDFYESDFSRFHKDAVAYYGEAKVDEFPLDTRVQKEAFYWYFNNRYFLEVMSDNPNCLCIAYDHYLSNQEETLGKICEHIGIDICLDSASESKKAVGPQTRTINLSRNDVYDLQFYSMKFKELMDEYFPEKEIPYNKINAKYVHAPVAVEERPFFGKTPLIMQAELVSLQKRLRNKVSPERPKKKKLGKLEKLKRSIKKRI